MIVKRYKQKSAKFKNKKIGDQDNLRYVHLWSTLPQNVTPTFGPKSVMYKT